MTRLFIAITYISFVIYGYQALKSGFASIWFRRGYLLLTLGVFGYFLFEVLINLGAIRYDSDKLLTFAVFLAFYILVFLLAIIMFLEDVVRILKYLYRHIRDQFSQKSTLQHWPERRAVVGKLGLFLGVLPFGAFLYGIFEGRYNFKVFRYDLEFEDLPEEFNGYTITHFSDVHSGGLDNRSKVAYAIDLMNGLNSDIIIFTGDFINRKSEEVKEWKEVFSKLKAPDGKFSILGNHDYGDYFRWESNEEQQADLENLKKLQGDMGFTVLCDECFELARNQDKLLLIGSENWSASSEWMQKGNIEKVLKSVDPKAFKIMLTHDPSHWERVLIEHPLHFHLTLSGHTHGYQFGVEIPGLVKWSPFNRFYYKYWAGLYKEQMQYINVNRGFGYTGFPGRVGIWPEISVIKLTKKT
ncbi:MAG: metallophosphoesterase [Bacteroidota bacterium]